MRQHLVDAGNEEWSGCLARLCAAGPLQHSVVEKVVVAR